MMWDHIFTTMPVKAKTVEVFVILPSSKLFAICGLGIPPFDNSILKSIWTECRNYFVHHEE